MVKKSLLPMVLYLEAKIRCHTKLIIPIDKQKVFRRDCMYNIENTNLIIGVSGVNYTMLTHVHYVLAQMAHCTCYAST